jgi:uncharacterized protein
MRGCLFVWLLCTIACDESHPVTTTSPDPAPSQLVPAIAAKCDDATACAAACDAGDAVQCRLLGNTLALGGVIARDEAHAALVLDRACELNDATGCLGAGRLFESGKGGGKDLARAADRYDRACKMGDPTGCYNSAIMLENGRGVVRNEPLALSLYADVCARGGLTACDAAQRLRERNWKDVP